MLAVLAGTVAPVFAIALIGAWMRSRLVLDPPAISRLALYLLSPALIFSGISQTEASPRELGRVALGVVALVVVLYVLGLGVAAVTRMPASTRAGYLLSTVFMNSGNYGLPLVLFAFGEEGFAIGVMYFVTQSFLTNTVGAYVASRGVSSGRQAISKALRVPALYAALLALPFPLFGLELPETVLRPVELLGRAAIPLLLLLLGAQLRLQVRAAHGAVTATALVTRLVISPLLALGVARVLDFGPLSTAVFVLESGMPTAVLTLVLSMEFDADTELLAGVVAYSTILSVVTLSVLILLLR